MKISKFFVICLATRSQTLNRKYLSNLFCVKFYEILIFATKMWDKNYNGKKLFAVQWHMWTVRNAVNWTKNELGPNFSAI